MTPSTIWWAAGGALKVGVSIGDGPPRLCAVTVGDVPLITSGSTPLAEIGVVGEGRFWSGRRYIDSAVAARMTYLSHSVTETRGAGVFEMMSSDEVTGLHLVTRLTSTPGCAAITFGTSLVNRGTEPVEVAWVTSAVMSTALAGHPIDSVDLWWADNDWLAECRWTSGAARTLLPDISRSVHEHDPRGNFSKTALGTWSTDGALPMGVLVHPGSGEAIGWQIEHNGPWHWQVGERQDGLYLSLLGPTDFEHGWNLTLEPGEQFTAVPATVAFSTHGFTGVISELTTSRRNRRRPHHDHTALPVIFNDYMNTLMGDPTTEKLRPLIDAAARAGAEIFCIDAGWYDDDAEGWWDSVGEWKPADERFPGGISIALDQIRDRGMVPGLWLEPEVVGVRSPMADLLPAEAFFQRNGERVVEHGRYQLDFRHPLTRKHLDSVIDRLVDDLGVGYLKLDYNINPGAGTDVATTSVGAALLDHNRAYLNWLDEVLERHPTLTLENCASGGMRIDYALLSRLQLQSTSDQQDPYRYPAVAAAAAAAITPEQAANWAYPQPGFTDDQLAFTLNAGMLGRLQLSGHLDHMTEDQLGIVIDGVTAYKQHRAFIAQAKPFWPTGLPIWDAGWISHGLRTDAAAIITLWRRDDDQAAITMELPVDLDGGPVRAIYPPAADWEYQWVSGESSALRITLPRQYQSLTFGVTPPSPGPST